MPIWIGHKSVHTVRRRFSLVGAAQLSVNRHRTSYRHPKAMQQAIERDRGEGRLGLLVCHAEDGGQSEIKYLLNIYLRLMHDRAPTSSRLTLPGNCWTARATDMRHFRRNGKGMPVRGMKPGFAPSGWIVLQNRKGVAALEYAVLALGIVAMVWVAGLSLRGPINAAFTRIADGLSSAAAGASPPAAPVRSDD